MKVSGGGSGYICQMARCDVVCVEVPYLTDR